MEKAKKGFYLDFWNSLMFLSMKLKDETKGVSIWLITLQKKKKEKVVRATSPCLCKIFIYYLVHSS